MKSPVPIALTLARPMYRRLRKVAKRLRTYQILLRLQLRHRWSHESLLGDCDVVVSLTTHGARLRTVALTVESIGVGFTRPRALILWLDNQVQYDQRPDSVRKLERRGLQVRLTKNYGPHTKYFPALNESIEQGLPLVTADDDILYPRRWLEHLHGAWEDHPSQINCYRASVVAIDVDKIADYSSWGWCADTSSSVAHFATGVSGVIYPIAMLKELRRRGTTFLEASPRADDIWLQWVALQAQIEIRQVVRKAVHFPYLPGTQQDGLVQENVNLGANDQRIRTLYSSSDVRALAAAGAAIRG